MPPLHGTIKMKINAPRVIVIIVIIIAGYLVISLISKNETKVIEQLLMEAKEAVNEGNIDKCMSFILPEYNYQKVNYEGLKQRITGVLKDIKPKRIKIIKKQITMNEKVAEVRLKVVSHPGLGSSIPYTFWTSWRFKLVKKDEKWWVAEIEPLE